MVSCASDKLWRKKLKYIRNEMNDIETVEMHIYKNLGMFSTLTNTVLFYIPLKDTYLDFVSID